jgi:hypothetical protein
MFSSPCSLRSAQCATLIALAAAAGISRFEPAPAKPAVGVMAIVSMLAAVAKTPQTPAYPVSIAACAHAAPIAQMTLAASAAETVAPFALAAEAPAAGWTPTPPAIESEISFFDWVGAVPTARQHSYPYAVGPPRRGTDTPLRAAGHALPGDSPARRSQVSRIARVSEFHFASGAHVTRTADSGPASAESFSPPSSAPRGELEFLPNQVRPLVRFAASAWGAAAFLLS